jgi:hypothetical protein
MFVVVLVPEPGLALALVGSILAPAQAAEQKLQ